MAAATATIMPRKARTPPGSSSCRRRSPARAFTNRPNAGPKHASPSGCGSCAVPPNRESEMALWLAVAVGGAAGSLLRWQLSVWLRSAAPALPWGTLAVNVSGSLLMGLIAGWCVARPVPDWLRIGLMTGVLGGYTTFSAFTLDTLELWRDA